MKLQRAKGDDLKRIQMTMGDAEQVLPTEAGLTKAVFRLPYVCGVRWRVIGPGMAAARVELRWWAFLTLGYLHARALRKTREIFEKNKAAGTTILVAVWG